MESAKRVVGRMVLTHMASAKRYKTKSCSKSLATLLRTLTLIALGHALSRLY